MLGLKAWKLIYIYTKCKTIEQPYLKLHYSWRGNDATDLGDMDTDMDTVREGVEAAEESSGEFRHTGHVAFNLSHSSMQLEWKKWRQSGMVLMVSLGWYSDRQIAQVVSLGFGSRRLSPNCVLGKDSMVGLSRPATAEVGWWPIERERFVVGRLGRVKALNLPQT